MPISEKLPSCEQTWNLALESFAEDLNQAGLLSRTKRDEQSKNPTLQPALVPSKQKKPPLSGGFDCFKRYQALAAAGFFFTLAAAVFRLI